MENITIPNAKYYEVAYDVGDGIFSVNVLMDATMTADLEAAKRTAARHAARYGYSVVYVKQISNSDAWEAKYKGKPFVIIDVGDDTQDTSQDAEQDTPDDYFILNRETGRLELHIDKATYQALDDNMRKRVKGSFFWGRQVGCWTSRRTAPNLDGARNVANDLGLRDAGETGEQADRPEHKAAASCAVDRDLLREQYGMVWGTDHKMVDYCVGKIAKMAILPGGEIIVVEKQHIETRFCFGESGYDYDDAQAAAQHARTSTDYFKRQNMKHFDEWLRDLVDTMNDDSQYRLCVMTGAAYYSQSEDCRLHNIEITRLTDIIDACGGSCYTRELPGKELEYRGRKFRVATREEHEIILQAYREAAKDHEKKVDAYLKRYGTSKVHAWTYWRDA